MAAPLYQMPKSGNCQNSIESQLSLALFHSLSLFSCNLSFIPLLCLSLSLSLYLSTWHDINKSGNVSLLVLSDRDKRRAPKANKYSWKTTNKPKPYISTKKPQKWLYLLSTLSFFFFYSLPFHHLIFLKW